MTIVYDEHGDEVAVIDVGSQRPIQPEASFTLAGRDTDCVIEDCDRDADSSDFCTSCRDELRGTA